MYWQGFSDFRPRVRFAVRGFLLMDFFSRPGNDRHAADPAKKDMNVRDAALRLDAGRMSSRGERRPIMTRHKFAIGQTVDFARRLPSMSRPTGPYEVMSVLPTDEADSPTYRVKSHAEPFARAARETDLVAIGLAPSQQAAPALWADPVSGRRSSRPLRSG